MTPHDKARRAQATSSSGFFGLPFEIRTQIYVWSSMQIGQPGSTKVLCLCSQTYVEAIWWYRDQRRANLLVNGDHQNILRLPKDFGMPLRLSSYNARGKRSGLQQYSKLQIMRMHKVALAIVLPGTSSDSATGAITSVSARYKKMYSNLQEVLNVIQKSELKDLELTFWSEKYEEDSQPCTVLQSFIHLIIDMSVRNRIALTIASEDRQYFHDDIPDSYFYVNTFADWTMQQCGKHGLNISTSLQRQTQIPTPITAREGDPYWPRPMTPSIEQDAGTGCNFNWAGYQLTPYRGVAECRYCLEPFALVQDLQTHLEEQPRHKRKFVQKRWNRLHRFALRDDRASRICWTCAKPYNSLDSLAKHLDECRHRRNGIIPRYAEDNKWYDRKNRPPPPTEQ